jgi:hypothetical protein
MLQRRLDALNKMADAAEELLADESDTPAASAAVPEADVPLRTGEKLKAILKRYPGEHRLLRLVWEEAVREGWAENSKDGRSAIRLALGRLAARDPYVSRIPSGNSYAFGWIPAGAADLAASNGHQPVASIRRG